MAQLCLLAMNATCATISFTTQPKRSCLKTTGFLEYDEFGSSYRFRDIEVFTPVNWTKDILELYRDLKQFTEQQEVNWEKKRKRMSSLFKYLKVDRDFQLHIDITSLCDFPKSALYPLSILVRGN